MNGMLRPCSLVTGGFLILVGATPATAQQVNESNLWFGNGPGIEVVFRTGENLAPGRPPEWGHAYRGRIACGFAAVLQLLRCTGRRGCDQFDCPIGRSVRL